MNRTIGSGPDERHSPSGGAGGHPNDVGDARTIGMECRGDLRQAEGQVAICRKIATAFWPPNPNPWTATVSTFALRAVSGT
jgi:hypothetical protein